jgi:hypothetical protein
LQKFFTQLVKRLSKIKKKLFLETWMSRSHHIACFLLAVLACPLAFAANQVNLTVTHDLVIARPAEMIAVPWKAIVEALPGAYVQKIIVKDAAGHSLPYQVINFADAADPKNPAKKFGDLLFQHDFAAGEKSAAFTIEKTDAIVPPFPTQTYARIVPERLDDFAWENDRIGHRAYGPALAAPDTAGTGKEVLVASGIDIWSKRVRYPVINRWYSRWNYHHDDGEGLDMYKTGSTRGTGGTGIWDGAKLHISGNFKTWKILANGPIRTIFELGYEAWDANGVKVSETKRFTVDAGHNLDAVESTFHFEGGQELTVALGITKNSAEKGQLGSSEAFRLKADHALAQWEVETTNGSLGEAVVLDEAATGYAEDAGNHLILAHVKSDRPLKYLAGAGWTRSGDFTTKEDWLAYVAAAAARAKSPINVTLSAH